MRITQHVRFMPGSQRGTCINGFVPVEAPPQTVIVGMAATLVFRPLDSRMSPFSILQIGDAISFHFKIAPTLDAGATVVFARLDGIQAIDSGRAVEIPISRMNTLEMLEALSGRDSRIMWAELSGFAPNEDDAVCVYRWKIGVESVLSDADYTEPLEGLPSIVAGLEARLEAAGSAPEPSSINLATLAAEIARIKQSLRGM